MGPISVKSYRGTGAPREKRAIRPVTGEIAIDREPLSFTGLKRSVPGNGTGRGGKDAGRVWADSVFPLFLSENGSAVSNETHMRLSGHMPT